MLEWPIADRWEEGVGRLLDYVDHHGHARVPRSYTIDGYRLGKWVNRQRSRRRAGTLDPDRERRLQDVPGWTWAARADKWEDGFGRLLDYVEHHGHARVPRSYTIDGYRLGTWIDRQRRRRIAGTVDPDCERRLEELPGWTWKASSST
ncbi:helicase associated domain-containing protein (plasmid) [Rhodococcus opacus]|nr:MULTISPECIES: helicase associated domain-containing protein [Rhodococcus]EKT78843.1 putative helicase [Rhodococcus opacus M213]MDV6245186.1 helicase associated domain-containing protein [Rhodococcus opacus]MDV7088919.1 helicase associated domain-containing protein [Rhodococcus opacus]WKN60143.1 helicase associated domain-containing protein [Rhodococcus opacus]